MSAPTWIRVKQILGAALELDPPARAGFLDRACEGDALLRAEVERLLAALEKADGLLDPPAFVTTGAWDSLRDEEGSLVGQRVGGYQVVRLIGHGGMGAVYEAEQASPRRRVAIKVVRAGHALSASVLRRFQYESQVLAGLRHPGIAQIYEAGVHHPPAGSAIPFFAMEFVPEARTITQFADEAALPLRERLALFVRVCDAAQYGHQRGVIHRDLKPANILIEGQDAGGRAGAVETAGAIQPKIIDFGVARVSVPEAGTAAMTQTGAGQIVGTLQYMSPEQCDQTPHGADVRSDVYTLGVVLYELVCGRPPHDISGAGILTAVRIIQTEPPPRPSTLRHGVRGDLETILLKALEKDPETRYQSAAALAADINHFLRSEPIDARPPSAAHQLRLFARRHKPLVIGVGAAALALLLGTVGTTIGLYKARAAERTSTAQAQRATRASTFLMSTLRSADPNLFPRNRRAGLDAESVAILDVEGAGDASDWGFAGERGRGASVAEVLYRAGQELPTSFADDPVLEAELSYLIGATLVSMNHLEGGPLVERAVSIQRRYLGDDDPATIRSMARYADILKIDSKIAESASLLKDAFDAAVRRWGRTSPLTRAVGRSYTQRLAEVKGRAGEALEMARRAASDAAASSGARSPAAMVELAHVAELLAENGDLGEAERLARGALDSLTASLGDKSLALFEPELVLADILRARGAPPEGAEECLRRAAAIQSYCRGPDHLLTLEARKNLIDVLLFANQLDDAVKMAREDLDSYLRVLGPEADLTLKAKARLARALTVRRAELPLAEQLAREAAEGNLRFSPKGDGWGVYYRAAQAAAIRLQGRVDEAERVIRAELGVIRDPVPMTPDMGRAFLYVQYSLCLSAQGYDDLAEQALLKARAYLPAEQPAEHLIVAETLETLADLYERTGRAEEAAKSRSALPDFRRPGHP